MKAVFIGLAVCLLVSRAVAIGHWECISNPDDVEAGIRVQALIPALRCYTVFPDAKIIYTCLQGNFLVTAVKLISVANNSKTFSDRTLELIDLGPDLLQLLRGHHTLVAFSVIDPRQNERSLLTLVSDPAFHALLHSCLGFASLFLIGQKYFSSQSVSLK